jgi:hypothetical protein
MAANELFVEYAMYLFNNKSHDLIENGSSQYHHHIHSHSIRKLFLCLLRVKLA